MLNQFEILPYNEVADWDSYVAHHPKGTIFHSQAMIESYRATHGYRPFAYAARSVDGKIHALIVSTVVTLVGNWAKHFTSRSIQFAEPLFEETDLGHSAITELIQFHDQQLGRSTLFSEIRPIFDTISSNDPLKKSGYQKLGYLNYELPLTSTEEDLWKKLSRTCRGNIRVSQKRGVTVERAFPAEAIDDFYALISQSYAHSRVPVVDKSLFHAVFSRLPEEQLRLYFAKQDGQSIATSCFLVDRGRIFYWYAGTHRIPGVYGMSCILWEAIKEGASTGASLLDFCGAGWCGQDYGPGRFKSHFGGTLTNHGRYRKIFSPWKFRVADAAYSAFRSIISPKSSKNWN
jgi:hypothetical protein